MSGGHEVDFVVIVRGSHDPGVVVRSLDDGVIGSVEEGLEETRGRLDEEELAESEGE